MIGGCGALNAMHAIWGEVALVTWQIARSVSDLTRFQGIKSFLEPLFLSFSSLRFSPFLCKP